MSITISKTRTLKSIQESFNTKFPYLKIEFFRKDHDSGAASAKKFMLDPALTIAEAGHFDHDEEISVDGHLKVSTFEHHFFELYGIGLQVFRKSGKAWIQTTATDEWTLAHQNQEGEADSTGQ